MRSHILAQARALPFAEPGPRNVLRGEVPSGAPVAPPARFIGRVAETEAILRAVRSPGSSGAVVVGAPGIGKTGLLHHVQRSLADAYVVRVRGLRSSASFPFRALSLLLSELPESVTHPALVLPAVAAHLREEAGGRRIVFTIDNAEHLDRASSTLIGQLVAGNRASLIMTVTDFAQADAAFMSLWRTSSLHRVDLTPFSFEDTVLFVASELGAPVSREGVEALWSIAGGNLQATRSALQGFAQRGVLARRGQAWVLLPERKGIGHEVVSTSPLLRSLTRHQRRIVDLVSLAGTLEWVDLARLADPAELDALQDNGVLLVVADPEPQVTLAAPGLAAAVAEEVLPEDAAQLYRDLQARPAAARRLARDPARQVGWLLQAGLPVGPEQGLAAAEALNRDGHHGRSAELIASLGRGGGSPRFALEALVAALGQGHLRDATAASSVLTASEDELDRGVWIQHMVEESRLRRLQSLGDPGSPLARAEERLEAWAQGSESGHEMPGRGELTGLRRRVQVARAELASFDGRYSDNLRDLMDTVAADLPAVLDREEREAQVTLQSFLLEAMVMHDPGGAPLGLAEALVQNLAHPEVSSRVSSAALMRAEVAVLVAGRWAAGRRVLQSFRRSSAARSLRRGSLADLAVSLDLIAQERVRDASAILGPVVEQLRVADPYGLLPLAAALLTYCHALTHPLDRGPAHLPPAASGRGSPWVVRRAARHYLSLSAALTSGGADAARQMQGRAPGDLRRGATTWALLSLVSAVRLGRTEAAGELKALSETLTSSLAAMYLLYAKALVEGDVQLVIQAMERAAASGDYRLAADIARSGGDLALTRDDRAAHRLIHRRLMDLLPERLRGGRGAAALDRLTAREREIAALAALGSSNRAIAQRMYVSVRTVEGHLYQVYSKLSVNTRAELSELFPTAIGS